jgi:hypothetical protein
MITLKGPQLLLVLIIAEEAEEKEGKRAWIFMD